MENKEEARHLKVVIFNLQKGKNNRVCQLSMEEFAKYVLQTTGYDRSQKIKTACRGYCQGMSTGFYIQLFNYCQHLPSD